MKLISQPRAAKAMERVRETGNLLENGVKREYIMKQNGEKHAPHCALKEN